MTMDLFIGYSSESGTTLDLVNQFIASIASKHSIKAIYSIEEDFQIKQGVWIFFIATTGQGEPPYTMRGYWKKLMSKNYKLKQRMYFSIYSMGDSTYGDNFGMAARKFRQRIKMLGAEEVVQIGLGDDQDKLGYRQVYLLSWRDKIESFLSQNIKPIELEDNINKNVLMVRKLEKQKQFLIADVKQLNSQEGRKVYWITMQSLDPDLTLLPGDIIELYPHNHQKDVSFIIEYFKLQDQLKDTIAYKQKQITIQKLVKERLNLSSVMNYYFFICRNYKLQDYCQDQQQKLKLIQFREDYDEYFNYIRRYKRNIRQFLQDFQLKGLELHHLIDGLNQIQGRKYSISRIIKKPFQSSQTFQILIKLVVDKINQHRIYKGLCSHDLVFSLGSARTGRILKGQFSVQKLKKMNIIITLGTGIAPFIQLFYESQSILLFYINRFKEEVYHHQIVDPQRYQKNTEWLSFTREGGPRLPQLLEDHREHIQKIIKQHGIKNIRIMMCGPKQLCTFITDFFVSLTEMSKEQFSKLKMLCYENW